MRIGSGTHQRLSEATSRPSRCCRTHSSESTPSALPSARAPSNQGHLRNGKSPVRTAHVARNAPGGEADFTAVVSEAEESWAFYLINGSVSSLLFMSIQITPIKQKPVAPACVCVCVYVQVCNTCKNVYVCIFMIILKWYLPFSF